MSNNCVHYGEKCFGFLCPSFKRGYCRGVSKSIYSPEGDFVLSIRPLSYEEEDAREVTMKELEKSSSGKYLTNQQVIDELNKKYGIAMDKKQLRYYATQRFIEGGFQSRVPGIKGTISFYKNNTPERIYFTRYLNEVYRFKFKKISEYSKILSMKNKKKLNAFKKYKIEATTTKDGREIIHLGDRELVNDFADFQEFSILRALFEVRKIDYRQKQTLPYDATVSIGQDRGGQDNIVVNLGHVINKNVVFNSAGIIVK